MLNDGHLSDRIFLGQHLFVVAKSLASDIVQPRAIEHLVAHQVLPSRILNILTKAAGEDFRLRFEVCINVKVGGNGQYGVVTGQQERIGKLHLTKSAHLHVRHISFLGRVAGIDRRIGDSGSSSNFRRVGHC